MPKKRKASPVECVNCHGAADPAQALKDRVRRVVRLVGACTEILECVGNQCKVIARACRQAPDSQDRH